jgi:hypothetical protein
MKTSPSEVRKLLSKNALLLAIIILLISTVFYLFVWRDGPYLLADSKGYMQVAQNISAGNLSEIQDRVPAFPLLLLLTNSFEKPNTILFIVQLLSYFVCVFFVFKILTRELPIGFAYVYLIFSVLPPFVEATAQVMTEALTTILILLSFICFYELIKSRKIFYAFILGFTSGFLALTRPTFELIPIILLILFVFIRSLSVEKKGWILHSIISIAISTLMIGGYALYNYIKYDFLCLTPLQGFNLSTKTETYIERIPDDQKVVREVLLIGRNKVLLADPTHSAVMYIWPTIPKLEEATSLSKTELSKMFQGINLKLILSSPLSYIVEVGHAMAVYTMPSSSDQANFNNNWFQLLWLLLNYVVLAVTIICICGTVGILILISKKGLSALLKDHLPILSIFFFSALMIFYNFCISTFFEVGNPRYRLPTDLLIIIFDLISMFAFIKIRKLIKLDIEK